MALKDLLTKSFEGVRAPAPLGVHLGHVNGDAPKPTSTAWQDDLKTRDKKPPLTEAPPAEEATPSTATATAADPFPNTDQESKMDDTMSNQSEQDESPNLLVVPRDSQTLIIHERVCKPISYTMGWESRQILMAEIRYLLKTYPDEKRTAQTIAVEIITRAMKMKGGWDTEAKVPAKATTIARWLKLTPRASWVKGKDTRDDGYQNPEGPMIFLMLDWFVKKALDLGMGGPEYRIVLKLAGEEIPIQKVVPPDDPDRKGPSQAGPTELRKRQPLAVKSSRTVQPEVPLKESIIKTGTLYGFQKICEETLHAAEDVKTKDVKLAMRLIAHLHEMGYYTPTDQDSLRVRVEAVKDRGIVKFQLQLEAVNADGGKLVTSDEFLRWLDVEKVWGRAL